MKKSKVWNSFFFGKSLLYEIWYGNCFLSFFVYGFVSESLERRNLFIGRVF